MDLLSVGDVAKRLGVNPPQVSDLFYKGIVRDDGCPIVGGRRLIPPRFVEVIAMALRRKGINVRDVDGPNRREIAVPLLVHAFRDP